MQTLASKLIPVAIASILCGVAVAGGGKEDKMSMMDKDGDGKVTAMEHAEGAKTMFSKMDSDGDGQVTAAEMDQMHSQKEGHEGHAKTYTEGTAREERMADRKAYDPSGTGKSMPKQKSAAQKIAAMDTNNDGKLSESEYSSGYKKMFSKMDSDGDGTLTAQEMRKAESSPMTASDVE